MQELAWASYSLLRNTNSSGVLVAGSKGDVQVVRGALRQAAGAQKGQAVLESVQKVRTTERWQTSFPAVEYQHPVCLPGHHLLDL